MNIRKLKKRIPKETKDTIRETYKLNIKLYTSSKPIEYNKWLLALFTNKYDKDGIIPL